MTITDILNNILGIKDEIKIAIEAAMVTVGDSPFSDYPSLIRSIGTSLYTPESYFIFDDDTQTIIGYNGGLVIDNTEFTPTAGDGNFSGGYGTVESPYLVATLEDLLDVENFETSHFLQVKNIDMSGYGVWLGICNDGVKYFSGVYDGGNFVILNMHSEDVSACEFTGLFSQTDGAIIKNVRLYNPHIVSLVSSWSNGVFVGNAWDSTFENCHVIKGSVYFKSGYGIGGFCGLDGECLFLNCSSDVYIFYPYENHSGDVGGFSSNSYNSEFESCHAHIELQCNVAGIGGGGFIGLIQGYTRIEKCSASGYMNGNGGSGDVGGFVGRIEDYWGEGPYDCLIKNCRTSVNLIESVADGHGDVGGFVGYFATSDSYTIENCYSNSGVVTFLLNDAFVGGLYIETPTFLSCYFDNIKNVHTSLHASSLTTAEMLISGNFTDWDFTTIWEMGDESPVLKFTWEQYAEYNVEYGLTQIKIPPKIRGLDVLHIGHSALRSKGLTRVEFPNTLLTIADYAFYDNDFEEITFPVNITAIGDCAFYRGTLTDMSVYVTTIGRMAFMMNSLTTILFQGENVDERTIGEYAFCGNNISDLSVSAQTIGEDAFRTNENIGELTIGYFHSIGDSAFYKCGITGNMGNPFSVSVDEYGDKTIGEYSFQSNQITSLVFALKIVPYSAFANNLIGNITISSVVDEIGDSAFSDNLITSLITNAKIIGMYAFSNNLISTLVLNIGVEDIGYGAFKDNLLTSLEFPEGVLNINTKAFQNNNITRMENLSAKVVGGYVFAGNPLTYLSLAESVETISDYAFYNQGITEVHFGHVASSQLQYIGKYAFAGNCFDSINAINELGVLCNKFPVLLRTIKTYAFAGNLLTKVDLHYIETVEAYAFSSNTITEITLRNLVSLQSTSMGTYGSAFRTYYNGLGRPAGTYEKPFELWIKTA